MTDVDFKYCNITKGQVQPLCFLCDFDLIWGILLLCICIVVGISIFISANHKNKNAFHFWDFGILIFDNVTHFLNNFYFLSISSESKKLSLFLTMWPQNDYFHDIHYSLKFIMLIPICNHTSYLLRTCARVKYFCLCKICLPV